MLKKNDHMKFSIGYPDYNITAQNINEYYKDVSQFLSSKEKNMLVMYICVLLNIVTFQKDCKHLQLAI